MNTPRFDLVDITHTLRNRGRFVLIITVVAGLLGLALSLVRKKKYEAQADIIMTNPLYTDRNNLFRANEMRFVDYFGGDDDADRVLVIAESDTVREMVAKRLNLADAYKLDMSKPADRDKLKGIFKKNFKVDRTEYKTCQMFYTDTDPQRAAAVLNEATVAMEEIFRGFYVHMRGKVSTSIQAKVVEMDSTIVSLTDTLSVLRDKYKMYDIVSPGRQNVMLGSIKSSGAADFGRGVEEIQTVEAVKDQLVTDRAKYFSLLNEFSTGNSASDLRLIQVITAARPPVDPKGPGVLITVLACMMLGFFFSALYVLIVTYYRLLVAVQR
ncbi:MAG: hypothetical protein EOP56_07625 [Sphingobacteriales bacterium]|nr:MAG: hypothetical protein EOP56_07625 [Sphingobacteriales bacterium]